jgi:L-lysine exporter family protein LysE/ArgO
MTPLISQLSVFLQAFGLSFGLIVAIGAQNAFVLRQGLRREHVWLVVVFCAVIDAALISAGVLGMAAVLEGQPLLAQALAAGGAVFLTVYGVAALRRARQEQRLTASTHGKHAAWWVILLQAGAFTLLNPHVYLDTVLLVGSIGAQQPRDLQGWFIGGAASASLTWFVLLGIGARWLAPWFAKPRAWQLLDAMIGTVMLVLAAMLVRHVMSS